MMLLSAVFALMIGTANAQTAPQPTTIDPQLWGDMIQALGKISMPVEAHQQVQAVLGNAQREAQARALRARMEEEKKITEDKKKKIEQSTQE